MVTIGKKIGNTNYAVEMGNIMYAETEFHKPVVRTTMTFMKKVVNEQGESTHSTKLTIEGDTCGIFSKDEVEGLIESVMNNYMK